jgi:hypothetical protein
MEGYREPLQCWHLSYEGELYVAVETDADLVFELRIRHDHWSLERPVVP